MNQTNRNLEQLAQMRKIKVHDPFAEFLHAQPILHSFELSLLDCYRFAGHACHAITGAFLVTETAIKHLFPDSLTCERGTLSVEFGSALNEGATGPRSNVISYLTGAWGESGFPGLRGSFVRKGLITYGNTSLEKKAVRFRHLSSGKSVVVEYDPAEIINGVAPDKIFPENWRQEIYSVLESAAAPVRIHKDDQPSGE